MNQELHKFNVNITDEDPWQVFPGAFGNSKNNIKIIDSFINLEDLKKLQDFTKKINKWDNSKESEFYEDGPSKYRADIWYNRVCNPEMIKSIDGEIYDLIDSYLDAMGNAMNASYDCIVEKRPPSIVCWRPGDFQVCHADKQLIDGRPNAFPNYDLNSLFYINDDYYGGELFYPQHYLKIKPKAGMAVSHPGDINYLHGVTPVLSNIRWVIPAFFKVVNI